MPPSSGTIFSAEGGIDRGHLLPWGETLDDVSQAQALAALGVWLGAARITTLEAFLARARRERGPQLGRLLSDRARTRWDIGPLLRATPSVRAQLEGIASADSLAAAWAVSAWQRERPVRLEIHASWTELTRYAQIVEELSSSSVGAAPFMALKLTDDRASLQWPLRLGVLANARSERLRAVLEQQVGWSELVDWIEVSGPDTPCDILIMDSAAAGPLEPLLPMLDDLDVGAILAFAPGVSQANLRPTDLAAFLRRNRVSAWGVALVDLSAVDAGGFLHNVVRELSHDLTLDVALTIARQPWSPTPAMPPLLFANPRALDEAHLTEFGSRLVDMLASANGGSVELPQAMAPPLPLPPGRIPHLALREVVATPDNFAREEHGATAIARVARATRARGEEHPRPARPRRLQTDIYAQSARGAEDGDIAFVRRVRGRLRPDTEYRIEVSIRYPRTGKVQAPIDIDLTSLPQDRRRRRLDVAFQELDTEARAQFGYLHIRADEESSAFCFPFRSRSSPIYRARIIVSYRGRVLQMVRFEAQVVAARRTPAGERPAQRLRLEASPHPSMADLGHRRSFDLAIVANHRDDGDPVVGVLKAGRYRQFGASNMAAVIVQLEDTLSTMSTHVGSLTSPSTQKLMRRLAINGARMYKFLKNFQAVDLKPKYGRMQIVSGSPDAFFPIEFVYDRTPPSDTAKLCAGARAALRTGTCSTCAADSHDPDTICPLGFWGLSRVIERHAFVRERGATPGLGGQDTHALLAEPTTGRNALRLFDGAVYGASDRADGEKAGSIQLVAATLGKVVGRAVHPTPTWSAWAGSVKQDAPSLLVLVCHTEQRRRGGLPSVKIEIGAAAKHEWLDVDSIAEEYVLGPKQAPRPVVLLIGCSTAVQHVQFSNAVANFISSGAAIVLSTLATILGAHAAQVTSELIERLATPARGHVTFGDALLGTRREMLAQDMPMAMALVAFGDADWRITHRAG